MADCFHCGQPIPDAAGAGSIYELEIGGRARRVCCAGCLAVARLIADEGLAGFYEFRTGPSLKPEARGGDATPWAVCDRPELERRMTRELAPGRRELRCRVDGIHCAACSWLIDRGLRRLDGIADVAVNPVTAEVVVEYAPERLGPGGVLDAIERLGFAPRPSALGHGDRRVDASRRQLKRLAVAGFGFAQVMTLSAALYLGAFKNMQASFESFFVFVSMLIATPVVLYAGAPIFRGAWRDVARRRLGMDVPVALAIGAALAMSLVNAFRGAGDVYFDSATMFVFFLTLGRWFEARARHRAGGVFDALADLRPLAACRRAGDRVERVGTIELAPGDRVVVEPGEAVPADGVLVTAEATFDEALLSGESLGRRRTAGDEVLGGSLNLSGAPVEIDVTRTGADSYVERIGSLLNRAMADRPGFLHVADRWASAFIAAVLVLTAAAGAYWMNAAPERAFGIVLSMLVVTCPCALALAAPTAFAVALGGLARHGMLLTSARVLERLRDVGLWLFDKTGTLTHGDVGVAAVRTFADVDRDAALGVAAALESAIEHPIARAFEGAAPVGAAERVVYRPGFGVTGCIGRQLWKLGSARHVGGVTGDARSARSIYLARGEEVVASFELSDRLRPRAADALAAVAPAVLVSGDETEAVAAAAAALGIDTWHAECTPERKLELLREWQAAGDVVAAVGDGINDAPLLAQADVSVAMVAGSRLAQASADVVFAGEDLTVLARLPALAAATRRVVRQNLAWAAAYNALAVPAAAAGWIAPWMAAIGMSLSSLIVVGNALRLNRLLAPPPPAPVEALDRLVPERGTA